MAFNTSTNWKTVEKTANYTIADWDWTVRCNSASDITITLPSVVDFYNSSTLEWQIFTIKNINDWIVTIACDWTETIDWKNTMTLNKYQQIIIQSNWSNWDLINYNWQWGNQRDYAFLSLSANQTTNLTTGNQIEFDTIDSNFTTVNNGQVTLKKGKTYHLTGGVIAHGTNASYWYGWYDVTNSAEIGMRAGSGNTSTAATDQTIAEGIITPTTDITVELRAFSSSGIDYLYYNYGTFGYIEEIASYEWNWLRKYTTGWINRSDWTNVHLWSNTTKNTDSNVTHNLWKDLKDLLVKVMISTDWTENNAFEVSWLSTYNASGQSFSTMAEQVDDDNLIIQTWDSGLAYLSSSGAFTAIQTEDWYYKIEVYDLTSAWWDSYWVQDDNNLVYSNWDTEIENLIIQEDAWGVDHTTSWTKTNMIVWESVVFWDCLFMKSDWKLWKSDADAMTTMPVMAMATETKSADTSCEVLLNWYVRDDTWNWTVWWKIYASEIIWWLTQTAPSDTDDVVQVLWIATHTDRMYFSPSLDTIIN